MRLSDVMGAMRLEAYAEIGLVLALAAFVVVVATTLWPGNREAFERAGRLPLEDDTHAPGTREAGTDG
jgi:cbb3-type cytochrome oxidase subunit 3